MLVYNWKLFSFLFIWICCGLFPDISGTLIKHDICIIAHVYNEPYLFPAWIAYHRYLGVSKFFIADDCSKDPSVPLLLELFSKLGLVEHFVPENSTFFHVVDACNKPNRNPKESKIFFHLFQLASKYCNYIIALDPDEYITHYQDPTPKNNILVQYLANQTAMNQSFNGLRMSWMFMDSHTQIKQPKGLLIENSFNGSHDRQIKSIGKVDRIKFWQHPHFPEFHQPVYFNNDQFLMQPEEVFSYQGCKVPKTEWYVRHYFLRSWEEYHHFRASRKFSAAGSKNPYIDDFKYWEKLATYSSSCNNLSKEFIQFMIHKVKNSFHHMALQLASNTLLSQITIDRILMQLNIPIGLPPKNLTTAIYNYFYDPPINLNVSTYI